MSDAYTEVEAGGRGALGFHGHVAPAEAIAEARKHWECQRRVATEILDALDAGNVKVFHQRGKWVAKNRREVTG